jgi:hypothetical protein
MTAEIISIVPPTLEECPCTREAVWEINYGQSDTCVLCGSLAEDHEVEHPGLTLEAFRAQRSWAGWR